MHYYLIAPTIVVRKNSEAFTYQSEKPLALGTIVRISVGKKEVTGVVVGLTEKPDFPTKDLGLIVAPHPLPRPLIQLSYWMSAYYATPLPSVLQAILPSGLYKKRRQLKNDLRRATRDRTNIVLNKDQSHVLEIANTYTSGTLLLHGVTGAGKTQVYIEVAKHEYEQGRSSIILVPEIALTPQLVAEFAHHFEKVIVTHSQMTEAERHYAWLEALASDTANPVVVIGPRSALFMPLQNLGLVVVDECHEPGFKQDQSPRYSALRAASMLVRFHSHAKAIFGSATPAIADYYLATITKSPILELMQTAVDTNKSTATLIDLKNRDNFREHRFVSDKLILAMRKALEGNKQILLFHNRRGTAPTTLCTNCGWVALCDNCQVPLTLHADHYKLLCHLCGKHIPLMPSCPVCHQPDVTFKGIGTKLIEQEIHKLFPKARIARFDADNAIKETLAARYQQLYDAEVDIIIGTQLLAKGLDLPHLRVVGVIQADSGLLMPDYQAEERVFQLLYQVAGRVGRTKHDSEVVIQTYQPDHPIIQLALKRDYQAFYEQQLRKRHDTLFPPFSYLLKLVCAYKTEMGAIRAAQAAAKIIRTTWPNMTILGPTPAFYERLGGSYRWQLLIKSKQRAPLVAIAKSMPPHWFVDLDPANLM